MTEFGASQVAKKAGYPLIEPTPKKDLSVNESPNQLE